MIDILTAQIANINAASVTTMRLFLFIHIIGGMVYFGLPFIFGRWYRGVENADAAARLAVVQSMLTLSRGHLNIVGLLTLATGIVVGVQGGFFQGQRWTHVAPVVMLISLGVINFFLVPALKKAVAGEGQSVLRKKIAAFSGIHHTLVTILVFFMVFKPF